jgi:hypothetical protein
MEIALTGTSDVENSKCGKSLRVRVGLFFHPTVCSENLHESLIFAASGVTDGGKAKTKIGADWRPVLTSAARSGNLVLEH